MINYDEFLRRLEEVRSRITAACERVGRDPREIQLLAVTKGHPIDAVKYVSRATLPLVGESRVQEAVKKMDLADFTIRWELVGHLQTNKAKVAAERFDRIQSVDRERLIHALDRHAGSFGKELPIFLQVNAGDDPAKFGVSVEEAPKLLETALNAKNLRIDGLMTIAPFDETREAARRAFARLRELRDELEEKFTVSLPGLSMGMSGDLVEAIEEGSTLIRIGTALFGARD